MGLTDTGKAELVDMLKNDLIPDNGEFLLIQVKFSDYINNILQLFMFSSRYYYCWLYLFYLF